MSKIKFKAHGGQKMAKETRRKLSDAAIAFIIKERENPLTSYTFEQIAKLVETKFKVSVSRNAVSKSYHKHKDDEAFKKIVASTDIKSTNVISKTVVNNDNSNISNQSKKVDLEISNSTEKPLREKPVFEPIDVKVDSGKDFNEDAHKEFNYQDFLIPKDEG